MARHVIDPDVTIWQLVRWMLKVFFAYCVLFGLKCLFWVAFGLAIWWYVANFP